jgi:oligopeptide transport system substrate-binding protein
MKPGIRYQPHPAFARAASGRFRLPLAVSAQLAGIGTLSDFTRRDTRELTAEDYVYGLKRLAHPRLHSPIFGLMDDYVVGLGDFAKRLKAEKDRPWIDLREHRLEGVEVIDRYSYRIRVKGKYPQFLYWLAMPFFAPMPWEADRFHSQPGMAEKNLTLDWYPIGTGPYMLTENNPNARMVLERNPNFREDLSLRRRAGRREGGADEGLRATAALHRQGRLHAREGADSLLEQVPAGLLRCVGNFIGCLRSGGAGQRGRDHAVRRHARAGHRADHFGGDVKLLHGLQLARSAGRRRRSRTAESARKLRQAISIAIDQEEFISIFQNGRGVAAQGPIPPGIFGHREGQPASTGKCTTGQTARPGASRSPKRSACWPKPAGRTGATRSAASRW